MRTQSRDTRPEAERVQIELIRKASIVRRFAVMRSFTESIINVSRRGIQKAHPEFTEDEVNLFFIALYYGQTVTDGLKSKLQGRQNITADIVVTMIPVLKALEQLEIKYYLVGAVAFSIYGFMRTTTNVDIVAYMGPEQVHSLILLLQDAHYIDEDQANNAIKTQHSFSAIHVDTLLKINVFLPESDIFAEEERKKVRQHILIEETPAFCIVSAEDSIPKSLEWYRDGKGISDQLENDVLGVIKIQGNDLDMAYLHKWAKILNVEDLLERSLEDAGLTSE